MLFRSLLARKQTSQVAMVAMETVFDEVLSDVGLTKEVLGKEIAHLSQQAGVGQDALRILREEIPVADMLNELKSTLILSRVYLEEIAQQSDPEELVRIAAEFRSSIERYDEINAAIQRGGRVDGLQIDRKSVV